MLCSCGTAGRAWIRSPEIEVVRSRGRDRIRSLIDTGEDVLAIGIGRCRQADAGTTDGSSVERHGDIGDAPLGRLRGSVIVSIDVDAPTEIRGDRWGQCGYERR